MSVTRSMGFRIGLHTAGISPRRLVSVLPLIDWVGFDIKAPFSDYMRITGHAHGDAVRASLACLVASGKPYEVESPRTTRCSPGTMHTGSAANSVISASSELCYKGSAKA